MTREQITIDSDEWCALHQRLTDWQHEVAEVNCAARQWRNRHNSARKALCVAMMLWLAAVCWIAYDLVALHAKAVR